jgi:plastocyanin
VLFALSTGHKIGLLAFAGLFIAFAVLSAFVLPRLRPQYPGRGLPLFVLTTIGLFAAMLTAVIVFGREGKEAEASGGTKTEATAPSGVKKVAVDESEFKIALPGGSTLKAGDYDLEVQNIGQIGHDLVIDGPGVKKKTPVFDSGQTESLKVTLAPGTYFLYCSVPGHKQAGMELNVKVS